MTTKKNVNLHKAKKEKNDEFYTQLSDIENEVKYYKDHIKGKTVFLNCDDPEESMFWKYFAMNFEYLGLKKLISTHFETDKPSYKLELFYDNNKDGKINSLDTIKTPLIQNGDFRSPESIEILKECDLVLTNPPFSKFREYIELLMKYEKKFLVLGNMNAITYQEIFKFIKENKIWTGVDNGGNKWFKVPDHYEIETENRIKIENGDKYFSMGSICWFTNLDHKKRKEKILLYKTYYGNESGYTKYDNYHAIEVSQVKDIPFDYEGIMGVPITFLDKYNPEQFEILGSADDKSFYIPIFGKYEGRITVNGKQPYKRIFIKKICESEK
jgi:hypothetical protein